MSKQLNACAYAVLMAVLALAAMPQRAAAQDPDDPPSRAARLSFLQGSVSFQPAGDSDWAEATLNRPMTTGDKLWADGDSRAELHLGSAAIRLDSNTGFSFLNLDDRTTQLQLTEGTLYVRVRRLDPGEIFEVDTPNQAFSILRPGEYRFEASEDGSGTMITVRDGGEGEAEGGDRTYTVESGERAMLTGTDSVSADIDRLERGDHDDFDDWCEMRDESEERSRSARYVSPGVVGYEDLDNNGEWHFDILYGEVWTPTTVPADWAPYRYGHWSWISPWGWTWVDDASWGYAPFHYGRWVHTRRGWGWVPGPIGVRPVYAPALVAFVGTPNLAVGAGAAGVGVAWFPLGPRDVYVPSYPVSREYVTRVNVSNARVSDITVTNVYNTTIVNNDTHVTRITYMNRNVPGAVTAVPADAFRRSEPVGRAAVHINEREMAAAPVMTRAEVAPTRDSLAGEPRREMRIPPREVVERPVVARTPPPPRPVPFEQQASALEAHPGQPLRHSEVEGLRPAQAEQPMIRRAPDGERDADRGRPEGRPEGQPDRGASGAFGNRPERPAEVPVREGLRNDRPDSVQPVRETGQERDADRGRPEAQPDRGASGTFGNRPDRPGQSDLPVRELRNDRPAAAQMPAQETPRNDRPSGAQPDFRGRAGEQQNQPRYEPTRQQPGAIQPSNAVERESVQPVRPAPPAAMPNIPERNDRPAVAQPKEGGRPFNAPPAQPNSRPPVRVFEQQGSRPAEPATPAAPAREMRPTPQPAAPPANRGASMPVPEPRHEVRPNPAPAAPAAAPRPAPQERPAPPQVRNDRPEAKPANAAPAPANNGNRPGNSGNNNSHGNKGEKKK